MSHHYVAVTEIPAGGERLQTNKIAAVQNICLLLGGAGAVISAILLIMASNSHAAVDSIGRSFAFSWLFGFEVVFTITVGALFWVLLHNASNSGWGVAIRRVPEVMSLNFVLLFFLGLPLAFIPAIRETVWTWIGHHAVINATMDAGVDGTLKDQLHAGGHETHLLYHKYGYLHLGMAGIMPGWDLRYVLYFAALAFGAWKMHQYSVSQDTTGLVKTTFSARRFAAGWLPMMAVCSSFAAIDWIEGLNYKWFSTMWPVNVFAASALSSMAVIILVVGLLRKTGHLNHIVSEEHFHIMGKLMHAFIIFWAYICFSQYFLIWYANIPEETQFYGIRNTGGWWFFSIALTFLHFVVPFLALLKRDAKKNLNVIMAIAVYVVFIHILEVYWWVAPQRGPVLYDASAATSFGRLVLDFGMDMLALITIAGLSGYFFFKRLAKESIYPCGDPRLEESVNLMN
jgi:hypothetical protein